MAKLIPVTFSADSEYTVRVATAVGGLVQFKRNMKIIDNDGKEVGMAVVIAKYFRKPDETTAQFMTAMKGLSIDDKTELARGAAKELGYEVVE